MLMTIFTSGTQARDGRTVNHDPEPWVCTAPKGECDAGHRMNFDGRQSRYTPRAKYDVLDNPILATYRSYLSKALLNEDVDYWLSAFEVFDAFGGWREWESPGHPFHSLTTATPEQIAHARRVFEKLEAVQAVSS